MYDINNIINSVICGRSENILEKIPTNSIDIIITSPPYDELRDYTGVAAWDFGIFQKIANGLFRVLKPGGVLVWVVGDMTIKGARSLTSFRQALYFQSINFNMFDIIIYEKAGSGPPHPNRYFNTYEYMFVLSKGKPKTINILKDKPNKWAGCSTYSAVTRREKDGSLTVKGKKIINEFGVRTNIWRYANGKGFATKDKIAYEHPAIFPEKLVQDHLRSWSNEGDLLLDPFGGSGTSAKVARELKRNWILIEAVPAYCELIHRRLGIIDADINH